MVVYLLGMILDMWDPLGYGNQVSAETLKILSKNFTDLFMNRAMRTVNKTTDIYGNEYIISDWPLEYYADRTILPEEKTKDRLALLLQYSNEYLKALKYNSNGALIDWKKHDGGNLLNQNDFNKLTNQMDWMVADQNTVVAGWVSRWWPIIIIVIIILIAFLLLIK